MWRLRNTSSYEKHLEDEVIKFLCDFGKESSYSSDSKEKALCVNVKLRKTNYIVIEIN